MENHKKLAHLLDVTQCVGCSACIVACAQTNYPDMLNAENTGWESLPANIRRVSAELARRPAELLVQCQQCENAPCITVCPFGANSHDPETGQVKTDPSRCVGCGYCVTACPYDARWMHPKRDFRSNAWAKAVSRFLRPARIQPALRPARHRPVHSAISTILQALFLSVCSTVAPNV